MIRLALKIAASTILVAGAAAAVALGSGAVRQMSLSDLHIVPPQVTPGGPLINVTDLRDGETRRREFTIENPNQAITHLVIGGNLTAGSSNLYDVLTASLSSAGSDIPLWSGRLRDLDVGKDVGSIDGDITRRYAITVGLPSWAGNDVQNRRAVFDLNFFFRLNSSDSDHTPPRAVISGLHSTRVRSHRVNRKRLRMRFTGIARDYESDLARVEVSLVRYRVKRIKKRRGRVRSYAKVCKNWVPLRRSFVTTKSRSCNLVWVTAHGTRSWSYRFPRMRLRKGHYELRVRAIDASGNVDDSFRRRGKAINAIRFIVGGRHHKRHR